MAMLALARGTVRISKGPRSRVMVVVWGPEGREMLWSPVSGSGDSRVLAEREAVEKAHAGMRMRNVKGPEPVVVIV